jgi:hypothetical protein
MISLIGARGDDFSFKEIVEMIHMSFLKTGEKIPL